MNIDSAYECSNAGYFHLSSNDFVWKKRSLRYELNENLYGSPIKQYVIIE